MQGKFHYPHRIPYTKQSKNIFTKSPVSPLNRLHIQQCAFPGKDHLRRLVNDDEVKATPQRHQRL
jgi:hypothetical protein